MNFVETTREGKASIEDLGFKEGNIMKCRVCNCDMKKPMMVYTNMAQDIAVLYSNKKTVTGKDTPVYQCANCGLYQIPFGDVSENYYLMSASQSPKMRKLQEDELKQIKELHPKAKSLLEVGCGDGNFLAIAKKMFDECIGIEPQEIFHEEYERNGLYVIQEYLDEKTQLKQKFDVVVARQTFEHVDNPTELFAAMVNACEEDGLIMLDIPNGEKSIRENRYYDFFSDHVNHWTSQSLVYLAEHNGMHIISVQEGFGGDYLQLFCRKNKLQDHAFMEQIPADLERIKNIINTHNSVAVYGAGAKAQVLFLLGEEELKRVVAIYDSDTKKEGMYLANVSIPVTLPSPSVKEVDAIIIFAKSYADEIIKQLKEEYGYQGDVYVI